MIYGNAICKLTRINYRNQVVSKFPKLIELYKKLFNEVPNNLHNSLNDVLVCFRCYFKMRYNLDILMEDEKTSKLNCSNCGIDFDIKEEIPILMPKKLEPLPN